MPDSPPICFMVAFLIPFFMLIVLDTNVFVGACLGTGASNTVVAACLQGKHTPLMGTALFTEYEDVLSRAELFKKCRLATAERDELLDIFLATCRWTRIYYGWRPNLPDESDNHLVELAVAGGAKYIVTRNLRDLQGKELTLKLQSIHEKHENHEINQSVISAMQLTDWVMPLFDACI